MSDYWRRDLIDEKRRQGVSDEYGRVLEHQAIPDTSVGGKYPPCVRCREPLTFDGKVWTHDLSKDRSE